MSALSSWQRRAGAWASAWVTAILAVAAAGAIGIGVLLALRLQDAEALESPLMLSIARQLSSSPWALYGPFGGRNLLVLIHAPLYYHLAALLAWPMVRAGLDPVTAALAAGRSLSMLGLALALVAAYRLARLDGAPARAGWLAIFLLASAPVVGVIPFAVRPDMLGVALQINGVLLVLSVLRSERPRETTLMAAFASFGLAICVKQHFMVGPLYSTCLLLAAWRRGQIAFRSIVRGLLTAATLVLVVYGTEELATGGRMSQAVFLAAINVARVHPSDWFHSLIVLIAIFGRSSALIALLVASCLAMVSVDASLGRRAFVAAGTLLVGVIVVLVILPFIVTNKWQGAFLLHAVFAAVLIVLPVCAFLEPRSLARGRLDGALWVYLAAELALMLVLCRTSTGAWVNYAIPSAVVAAVLTARVLDRALGDAISYRRLIPIATAASILPIGVVMDPYVSAAKRRNEGLAIAQISQVLGRPSSEFFFVGRPGDNRVRGRLDLVYDEWLYPVFESMHLAEPRSIWLRRALTAGPVRFVVNTSESPQIDGLGLTLPQLGYSRRIQVGPFFVWERIL
ncbi:MAG: hypothetical protein ACHRXM_19275 [Isosphaerales bacterium]